ncbi:MAG: diguanylate cyclase [Acholeplasmatales bacterium]|jgi:diguanylate cyclase (GGDEF)-like protein/PAS domain S-box-containing protein|nr:diguanylate cyclase [Acholeplasmataceae bacterium]MDY0115474.1 diguanylate cyclase [Acholeplasmatales bacterium]MCK9234521.1 diguanylate cyclase [Acholeplasmataceae bacterium]MCK9288883.1 diguanylate cyclase [Acholeplasmataceae bacterium]MCK9427477.1 diguanylate cyclase [Acholeplasmataceae bacterium]
MVLAYISCNLYEKLIVNGLIVIFFVSVSSLIRLKEEGRSIFRKIIRGVIIGLLTISTMILSLEFESGNIFDARTVILSLAGLFYGPIPTGVAWAMALVFRIFKGTTGLLPGLLTITSASLIGLFWPLVEKRFLKNRYLNFLLLGLVVHIVSVLLFLISGVDSSYFSFVLPVFLIIFPLTTLVAGVIADNNAIYYRKSQEANEQKILLKYSIDATPHMEIYALDENLNYLLFNNFHRQQIKRYYNKDIAIGDYYLDNISHPRMKERLKKSFNQALLGKIKVQNSEVEVKKGKYLEEHFTPMFDKNGKVIGISVFSSDITEFKNREQAIFELSYLDPLTNIYNRRYFEEQVKKLIEDQYHLFSIITFDVNGLKLINDTFGHHYGDELLIKVANNLKNFFSEKDIVCRVGGDEYYIILPGQNYQKATLLLKRAKYEIEKEKIKGINISISGGVVTKTIKNSLEMAFQEAENLMYRNKLSEAKSHKSNFVKVLKDEVDKKRTIDVNHSDLVKALALKLALKLNLSKTEQNEIALIGEFCDIGKVGISKELLLKETALTAEEYEKIKTHPEIAFKILSVTEDYYPISYDVLSHHERYDGTGYPRGLKGEEIPFKARLISVCDAYIAMTTLRPYRKTKTKREALAEMRTNSGTQFDPLMVNEFIKMMEEE